MSDLCVGLGKTGVVKNLKNVGTPIDKIEAKKENDKSTSTAAKVALAGLGAAAAITAGILAIRKGHGAKAVQEIGIDSFKASGNTLVKGKAFTKDGKPFSGVISQIGKDGLKHNIEYVNGVIKEVKTYKPSAPINGKVYDLPLSKKSYNYNAEGKLESVENFSWGHVSAKDPKKSGMQYIKTSTTNLDKKRADGLDAFARKQSEIKKQKEIEAQVAAVRDKLSGKTQINAQKIDDAFNGYETKNYELESLSGRYQRLEQKEQQIKENVSKLKEKMHQKTEINAQKIDEQYSTNKELQEMNDYYKTLEQKEQQIKDNVAKLKEKMQTKPEINAETIDARFANKSDELAKLKESLLNPKPYESKVEKQLLDDISGVVNNKVSVYGSNIIDTKAAIAEKLKSCWTLYGQEFRSVDFVVKIGNEWHRIIFDGLEYSITDKGEILRKIVNKSKAGNDLKKIEYENLIEKLYNKAKETLTSQKTLREQTTRRNEPNIINQRLVFA